MPSNRTTWSPSTKGAMATSRGHKLRLELIRHPTFARIVHDIVVEFGSARYQDVMDHYIGGEDVPVSNLRHAWQDTTQHAVWDVPIFEEFFRAVRVVNQSLAKNRQLRVLLADPPIDWSAVKTAPDHFKWLRMRDTHGAELIQREVLAKKRKALLIFGAMHLQRKNISATTSRSMARRRWSAFSIALARRRFSRFGRLPRRNRSRCKRTWPGGRCHRSWFCATRASACWAPPCSGHPTCHALPCVKQALALATRTVARVADAGDVRCAALPRAHVEDHHCEAPRGAVRGHRVSADAA